MPGTKWKRSLKRPALYEDMRESGMSKSKAARLSNWLASKRRKKKS
jgi:hypothetical protein